MAQKVEIRETDHMAPLRRANRSRLASPYPVLASGCMLLYAGARLALGWFDAAVPQWVRSLAPLFDWVVWLGIGMLLGSVPAASHAWEGAGEDSARGPGRGKRLVLGAGGSVVGLLVVVALRIRGSLDLSVATMNVDFNASSGQTLAIFAFGLGLFLAASRRAA